MNSANRNRLYIGILVVCGVLIYAITVTYGFINIDDPSYIINNPDISGFTIKHIIALITGLYANMWSPVTMIALFIEHSLWGNFAGGYHAVNMILHIANAILVFYLINRLSKSSLISFSAALLFLIHPAQIESVAWVSEQKSVLSTMFLLISVITYIRAKDANKGMILPFVFFILSVLSKVTAVIIPLLLMSYDVIILKRKLIKTALKLAPWFLVSIFLGILYTLIGVNIGFSTGLYGNGVWTHILTVLSNFAGITQYPVKLIFPFYLHAIMYTDNPVMHFFSLQFAVTLAVLILIGWLTFTLYKKGDRNGLFFLFWYFITFSVGSGIIPMPYEGALRFFYVPLIGIAFFAGRAVEWFYGLKAKSGIIAMVLLAGIAIAFIASDIKYVPQWKDNKTFWSYQLAAQPDNSRDMAAYATVLLQHGQVEKALLLIKRAQKTGANDTVVWLLSYKIYLSLDRYYNALNSLKHLQLIYMNMYHVSSDKELVSAGRQSLAYYGGAITDMFNKYAIVYTKLNNFKKAEEYILMARKIRPFNKDSMIAELQLLLRQRNYRKVIITAKKYLNRRQNNPQMYIYISIAYYKMGMTQDAVLNINRAIELVDNKALKQKLLRTRKIWIQNRSRNPQS